MVGLTYSNQAYVEATASAQQVVHGALLCSAVASMHVSKES